MRVIAGCHRGRRLQTVAGRDVRPTADRVKEAMFSMIDSRFTLVGARVLDLYAGSGALGIEAASRGAAEVVFVDSSAAAVRVLRDNLAACRMEARVLTLPAARAVEQLEREERRFDGVLIDPPYASEEARRILAGLGRSPLLGPGAWLVVEAEVGWEPDPGTDRIGLISARRYGKTLVAVYECGDGCAG